MQTISNNDSLLKYNRFILPFNRMDNEINPVF